MPSPFDPVSSDTPPPERPLEPDSVGDAVDLSQDLYDRIVQQVREICETVAPGAPASADDGSGPAWTVEGNPCAPAPLAPRTLTAAGISRHQLSDLLLKLISLHGTLTRLEAAGQVRLPLSVVEEVFEFLREEDCLQVASGDAAAAAPDRFMLTESGRTRARHAFEECRYVGPAPVALSEYAEQCRRQGVRHLRFGEMQLREALRDLVVDERFLQRLGPAMCNGQALFLFGPTGSGKTVIAKALGELLRRFGGAIHVPYALSVDSQIVTLYDPVLHQVADPLENPGEPEGIRPRIPPSDPEPDAESEPDRRWRCVVRPVVMTGGELTLEMLDLRYHSGSGFYTAPLQIKANGGLFLLDDFGRQRVPLGELLNRWSLPLEERIDHLTLTTGRKFAVPFEQMTIFSTNLPPDGLADPSFLRRIRHKIGIGPPSEQQFRAIFRLCCEQRGLKFDDWVVTRLLTRHYNPQIQPKSSDPRNLLDVMESLCRFRGERPHISEKLMSEAFAECLGGLCPSD